MTAEQERAAVVAWLRQDAQECDCFAYDESECMCGAWGGELGEPSMKTARVEDMADAIQRGDHHK
jgi:hypothetical protein